MQPIPQKRKQRAISMIEVVLCVGIFGVVISGIIVALTQLNRFATTGRNLSNAKELCQEQIEKVLTVAYEMDKPRPLLLKDGETVETTRTGINPFNGLPETEGLAIFMDTDDTTVRIPATRKTTVSRANVTLPDPTIDPEGHALLSTILQITVRVEYVNRGKAFAYEMYTLRSPD